MAALVGTDVTGGSEAPEVAPVASRAVGSFRSLEGAQELAASLACDAGERPKVVGVGLDKEDVPLEGVSRSMLLWGALIGALVGGLAGALPSLVGADVAGADQQGLVVVSTVLGALAGLLLGAAARWVDARRGSTTIPSLRARAYVVVVTRAAGGAQGPAAAAARTRRAA